MLLLHPSYLALVSQFSSVFSSNVGISRSMIVGRGSTYLMSAIGVSPLGVQGHVFPENLEKVGLKYAFWHGMIIKSDLLITYFKDSRSMTM